MKICYLDESGTGDEPIVVIAGVVVDSQRMHVTKDAWASLLHHLSGIIGRDLDELHTKDFYRGNTPFRTLSGAQRANYISAIIEWLCERKHNFVYSAIDKTLFLKSLHQGSVPPEISTAWCASAFHIVLALQHAHQGLEKTKGHTILVFDQKVEEKDSFAELVLNPPAWSDSYYGWERKSARLSHIIDVPYFADSKHVSLIQVADFLAYFLRKHAEIAEGFWKVRYKEEQAKIGEWINMLSDRCIGANHIYRAKGRCTTAEFFYRHCPASLRKL
jgi:hypothetical protein